MHLTSTPELGSQLKSNSIIDVRVNKCLDVPISLHQTKFKKPFNLAEIKVKLKGQMSPFKLDRKDARQGSVAFRGREKRQERKAKDEQLLKARRGALNAKVAEELKSI
jgi:hypothetical protein